MSLTLAPRPPSRHTLPDEPPVASLRAWLSQLASTSAKIAPFVSASLPSIPQRIPAEYHAASRAAACPDLFVIHAPDPGARERVIADVVCATPTERVLVLSTNAVTADRIVERLVKLQVSAVRALAEDENPVRPTPGVARSTSAALVAARQEHLKREAAMLVAHAAAWVNTLASAAATAEQITELTGRLEGLSAQRSQLLVDRERIEHQVQTEVSGSEVSHITTRLKHHLAEGQAGIDSIRQKRLAALALQKEKEAHVVDLRRHASDAHSEAAKKSGFFTRLLGKPKSNLDPGELTRHLASAERELEELAANMAALQNDITAAETRLRDECHQLIEAEIAARRAAIDVRLADLQTEQLRLTNEKAQAIVTLGAAPLAAEELALARQAADNDLAAARQRASDLERTFEDVAREALAAARVVVGMPGSLATDPVFHRDSRDGGPLFDLLVLDRAEELTEPDFLRLARLARRWVMVGDVATLEEPRSSANGSRRNGSVSGRNGRAIEAPFAARLAQLLDREKWTCEADRLVCRLAHLNSEERRRITREPLLDRPEIELRFASTSDGEAVLAEVAFPPALSMAAAKSFLYHQLGERLLRPCGEIVWRSTDNTIAAMWPAADHAALPADSTWIDLEPGIREKLVGTGINTFTAAVAFDGAFGWDSERAIKWIDEHLSTESPCRFAAILKR